VEDPLVYAKPLTHTEFKSKLENLKVSDVGRHGKYFWLRFDSSPLVLLLHFGMTGWIKVKGIETHFVVMENGGDKVAAERIKKEKEQGKNFANDNDGIIIAKDDMEWPPKYHKFILTADDGTQVAFTDPRRLGRIRILEASTEEKLMKLEPLKKLGIDYSNPQGRLDLEKFSKEVLRRNPPIKALLMDQAVFSGVGNWVA
jgi:formamidopyrimidine-DNA glycosylase